MDRQVQIITPANVLHGVKLVSAVRKLTIFITFVDRSHQKLSMPSLPMSPIIISKTYMPLILINESMKSQLCCHPLFQDTDMSNLRK